MTSASASGRPGVSTSRSKNIAFSALLLAVGVLAALVLAEIFLRVVSIPGIELNTSRYDDLIGYGLYPNAIRTYRGRERVVKRPVNRWGYLDKEYDPDRASWTRYRIGFFGDSYTEARQVELEDAFFRLVEGRLSRLGVETLAFGQSGFSMLQSYLTTTRWIDSFDIDLVVYVFVENDLGDQLREIKKAPIPYPVLSDGGLTVDNSFRADRARREQFLFRVGDYLTAHSLLMATISQRLRLLLEYGTQIRANEADRMMSVDVTRPAAASTIPNENDPPSEWPVELKTRAQQLGASTLLEWRDYVHGRSKEFAVIYVPRPGEMSKPTQEQNSWKNWLVELCAAEGITLIDPTSELLEAEAAGKQVFSDHFTPDGHSAFATSFVAWFLREKAASIANE